jgi:hypothetical protein
MKAILTALLMVAGGWGWEPLSNLQFGPPFGTAVLSFQANTTVCSITSTGEMQMSSIADDQERCWLLIVDAHEKSIGTETHEDLHRALRIAADYLGKHMPCEQPCIKI